MKHMLLPLVVLFLASCDSQKNEATSSADSTTQAAALDQLIESTIESSPCELWATLHQEHPEYHITHPDLKEKLLARMIEQDAKLALDTVVASPDPDPKIIEQVAHEFVSGNPEGLWIWYHSRPTPPSPEITDAVASAASRYFRTHKKFGMSGDWLKLMTPSEKQMQLKEANWEAHHAHKKTIAAKNPKAFIDKIIEKNREYEDCWLELGFDLWVEESPETARQWYDSNKDKLRFSQRDFIMMSYARTALKNGDLEGARKIGRRIADPQLKAKLKLKTSAAESPEGE